MERDSCLLIGMKDGLILLLDIFVIDLEGEIID